MVVKSTKWSRQYSSHLLGKFSLADKPKPYPYPASIDRSARKREDDRQRHNTAYAEQRIYGLNTEFIKQQQSFPENDSIGN